MGRKRKDNTLTAFNSQAARDGITYAEAQIKETQSRIDKIRTPRGEDGEPVYMKVSARNVLKSLENGGTGK